MESKILKDFREYWDEWHSEWKNENSTNILGWKVPDCQISFAATQVKKDKSNGEVDKNGKPKQEFVMYNKEVYKAIPEPYFIHKDILDESKKVKLSSVFININPGPPKFYHLHPKHKDNSTIFFTYPVEKKNNSHTPNINWIQHYVNQGSYLEFISKLIDLYTMRKNKPDLDKFWHNKLRVQWLIKGLKKSVNLKNIASFEIIPWHTNSVDEIKDDWYNYNRIEHFILNPAVYLCQNITNDIFKNKIISRGKPATWKTVFDKIVIENSWKRYDSILTISWRKNKYFKTIIWYNSEKDIYFFNFSGMGFQGMDLPELTDKTEVILFNRRFPIMEFLKRTDIIELLENHHRDLVK